MILSLWHAGDIRASVAESGDSFLYLDYAVLVIGLFAVCILGIFLIRSSKLGIELIAAALTVSVIAGICLLVLRRNKLRAAAYDAALQALSNEDYTSAQQGFSAASGYRDAKSLAVYCQYADIYRDKTDYMGGLEELSRILLQYDTGWQHDINMLESRVQRYKTERDAARKREQTLKEQYSGKLPEVGMPASGLKYTSLGEPDRRLDCQNFNQLEQDKKYFNVYWYNEDGVLIAAAMCAQWKGDTEFMVKSFSQYSVSGGGTGQDFDYSPPSSSFSDSGTSGRGSSGGIRDDYDSPEDLWEDNQDLYEDEDEAWDEWYDG